jgi:hypothetical protein
MRDTILFIKGNGEVAKPCVKFFISTSSGGTTCKFLLRAVIVYIVRSSSPPLTTPLL